MRTEETGIEPRRRMREFSLEREERKKIVFNLTLLLVIIVSF